jgi:hypothetical protein
VEALGLDPAVPTLSVAVGVPDAGSICLQAAPGTADPAVHARIHTPARSTLHTNVQDSRIPEVIVHNLAEAVAVAVTNNEPPRPSRLAAHKARADLQTLYGPTRKRCHASMTRDEADNEKVDVTAPCAKHLRLEPADAAEPAQPETALAFHISVIVTTLAASGAAAPYLPPRPWGHGGCSD